MTEQKIAKEKMLTIDKELKKTNPVYITVDRLVSKMKLSVLAENQAGSRSCRFESGLRHQ